MELAHTVTCLLALPVTPDSVDPPPASVTFREAAAGGMRGNLAGSGGGPFSSGNDDDSDDYWRALAAEVVSYLGRLNCRI